MIMKILVIDNNTTNFTKIKKVFKDDEVTEISNTKEIQHIVQMLKSEADISLIIINDVLSNLLNKQLLYREIRKYRKNIPVIRLGIA